MADNYLERKMEELRSGRLASGGATRRRMPGLSYPCSAPRVLIFAGPRKYLRQFAAPFQRMEAKIAIFNTLPAEATDLGADHGCRYYDLSAADSADAFFALTKAWRDIDLFLILDDFPEFPFLLQQLDNALPYPNDWRHATATVERSRVARRFIPVGEPLPDADGCREAAVIPWLLLKANAFVKEIILD